MTDQSNSFIPNSVSLIGQLLLRTLFVVLDMDARTRKTPRGLPAARRERGTVSQKVEKYADKSKTFERQSTKKRIRGGKIVMRHRSKLFICPNMLDYISIVDSKSISS